MSLTQKVSSRLNLKQKSPADMPINPLRPATYTYEASSIAGQTSIALGFSVPQTSESKANFFLFINGQLMREGASNDYTFTSVAPDNTSAIITLAEAIEFADVNIVAKWLGIVQPQYSLSSLQSQLNNLLVQPTVTRLLSGSGTYNKPTACRWIEIEAVAGGGGGGGAGTGSTGGTTSMTGLFSLAGGTGGAASATGGSGGAPTMSGGTTVISMTGNDGGEGDNGASGSGGAGGPGPWGGRGRAGNSSSVNGTSAIANSGAGGGGRAGGGGGGAGAYCKLVVTNPASSYSYSVGALGAGSAGGGDGGSGVIVIKEHY